VIYVIATVELQADTRALFLSQLASTALEVRREAGCIEYTATVDVPSGSPRQLPLRAEVVTIVEKWLDLESLTAHLAAPHMLAFRQRTATWVRATSLQVLSPPDSTGHVLPSS
jgi:quinol monooxygenase YgiN